MTSRYVRPDVKAQHHDYEDADCPFHAGNLSIIWERLFSELRLWLSECGECNWRFSIFGVVPFANSVNSYD